MLTSKTIYFDKKENYPKIQIVLNVSTVLDIKWCQFKNIILIDDIGEYTYPSYGHVTNYRVDGPMTLKAEDMMIEGHLIGDFVISYHF